LTIDWKTGLLLAMEELARHKLRTLLTMLGMVFGVGAVISMLSVGEGAEREALRMIDAMGLRNVRAVAASASEEERRQNRRKSLGLAIEDLRVAIETMPYLSGSAALKEVDVYSLFSHHGRSSSDVLAVSPSYFELSDLALARGRSLHELDDRRFAQVCVIGSRTARDLFGRRDPIGERLKINQTWFTVVGVLADRAVSRSDFEGIELAGVHSQVYVPIRTALKRFAFKPLDDELDEIVLQVREGVPVRHAAATFGRLLQTRHRGVDDYSLVVPEALLEQNRRTRRIFNVVMSCIAGISLLVGGIGIMNIMLANVLERTWEIGIRRAIGAKRRDIKRQFLVESFTISALGGTVGVVLGLVIAKLISVWSGWPVSWYLPGIVLAVGVCAGVGLLFGIYPAIKASQLHPIEALRRS
jgi:putative ABC transport system permease protein